MERAGPVSERSRIARNAATSYAARGLLLLSVLFVTPYLFRRLGIEGFGTWSVMLALTAIFTLLEVGFSDGIVRLVAAARAGGDREELTRTIAAAGALLSAGGAVAFAVAAAAAFLLAGLAAESEREAFTAGMLVLGAAMLVRFPCVAWGAALRGYQRYDLSNASFMATVAIFSLGAVAAVESGAGVFGLAVAQAGALVAGGVVYGVSLAAIDRAAVRLPRLVDAEARRRILRFSSFTLAAESFLQIGQRLDVAIIAALRSAGAAAPYAAALKLQSGVQGVTLPFVDLLMPMASELWARGERKKLLRRLTLATRIAAQLTFPLAFGIALFATDIVDVWLGAEAPPVTASIVVVLMAVQALGLTAAPARKVLIGVGRVRMIAFLSMLEGVGSVVLTVVLVLAYGALGAALATLAMVAVIGPLKLPLACRTLGFPTLAFLRGSFGPALAASAPAAAVMAAIWASMSSGPARLAAGAASGLAVWLAVSAAQVGPRRVVATLSSRARLAGLRPGPIDSELRSTLPVESARLPQ